MKERAKVLGDRVKDAEEVAKAADEKARAPRNEVEAIEDIAKILEKVKVSMSCFVAVTQAQEAK